MNSQEIRDIKALLFVLMRKVDLLTEGYNEIKQKLEEVSQNVEGIRSALIANSKDMIKKKKKK